MPLIRLKTSTNCFISVRYALWDSLAIRTEDKVRVRTQLPVQKVVHAATGYDIFAVRDRGLLAQIMEGTVDRLNLL